MTNKYHAQPLSTRPKPTNTAVEEWLKENKPTILTGFEKPVKRGEQAQNVELKLKADWLVRAVKNEGLSKKRFFTLFDKVQRQQLKDYLKQHYELTLYIEVGKLKNGKNFYKVGVK